MGLWTDDQEYAEGGLMLCRYFDVQITDVQIQ